MDMLTDDTVTGDQLVKAIEREQTALTTFLAGRAELDDDDRVTLGQFQKSLSGLRDLASSSEALNAFRDLGKATSDAQAEADELKATAVDKAFKSIAATVLDDEGSAAYLSSPFALGKSSSAVAVKGIMPALKAASGLVNTATATQGAELLRVAPREWLEQLWRPRTVLDLVTRGDSDFDSVEWVETIFTNNAAEVGEATALVGASGLKPDSLNENVVKQATAVTIAHLKHSTERALRNRGEVANLIENELSVGLEERIDLQLTAGNGTAPNMRGALATSGTQAQAFATDMITTLVKARTKVRLARSSSTPTVLLNPVDYEAWTLTKDGSGDYMFAGTLFGSEGVPGLLGMRFVESETIPAGVAIVADWASATLQTIDAERIVWTDSHMDYFARNIRSCRAEIDVLFSIRRPGQFVVADLTP